MLLARICAGGGPNREVRAVPTAIQISWARRRRGYHRHVAPSPPLAAIVSPPRVNQTPELAR